MSLDHGIYRRFPLAHVECPCPCHRVEGYYHCVPCCTFDGPMLGVSRERPLGEDLGATTPPKEKG